MVLGSAFRSLSCTAAARLLRLEGREAGRQGGAVVRGCAALGSSGAGRALSSIQMADCGRDASAVLVFRS